MSANPEPSNCRKCGGVAIAIAVKRGQELPSYQFSCVQCGRKANSASTLDMAHTSWEFWNSTSIYYAETPLQPTVMAGDGDPLTTEHWLARIIGHPIQPGEMVKRAIQGDVLPGSLRLQDIDGLLMRSAVVAPIWERTP